jgi:patatin-like phospholipase/acyl hydrolase
MSKYTILSIDGGGIRGIIPATVLVELEKMIQKQRGDDCKIGECFDFIAGTSIGGILACLLITPDPKNPGRALYSAQEALDVFLNHGDKIFDRSLSQRFISGDGLLDEKYSAKVLENVLNDYFKDVQMKELIRPCLIPGYNVEGYCPYFFTQHDTAAKKDKDEKFKDHNFLVRDVARATSAAPTYFEAALTESVDKVNINIMPIIDGGVFANNPTACAYVEVLEKGRKEGKRVNPKDIAILSLGTGGKPQHISFDECKDWGLIGWARPLIDILMEGVAQTVHYQMEHVCSSISQRYCGDDVGEANKEIKNYLRIDKDFVVDENQLPIDKINPELDCATKKNMDLLRKFGKKLFEDKQDELKKFVEAHLAK